MAPLASELAGWTRVFALDMPGFGLSAKPVRVLDIAGMADATVAWMSASGIERAILVGNSVGSQVAVNLAARYPERVEGVALTGLALGGLRRSIPAQLWRALIDAPREPLAIWPMHIRDFVAAGPRRVVQTFVAAFADRMERWLPLIEAPTLIVEGTADPLDDPAWNRTLAEGLARGRRAVVLDGTHAMPMSKPRELATLVRTFAGDVRCGRI